jgi:tetratricopeptide (TPR) repeat protein
VRQFLQSLTRSPRRLFLTGCCFALLGVAGYLGSRNLWAAYHFRQAGRAIDRRDWSQARANLRLCLEVWPGSAATHFLAGRTARRADDYEDAVQHLDECERLGDRSKNLELERALLRAQQGDIAPVERQLVDLVEQNDPDAPLILEALIKGYVQTSRLPLALYCAAKWLRLQPDSVEALFWRGQFYEQLFSHDQALEDFRRVVELDPEHKAGRLHLAEQLVRHRLFDEALPHLQRLAAQDPGSAPVLLALARCQGALGHSEEAVALLDNLLRAQPRNVAALVERGKLALDADQLAEAESWARKAVEAAPRGRTAIYFLGQCLERRGRHEEAKIYSAQLKEIDAAWARYEQVMGKLTKTPLDPALRSEAGTLLMRVGKDEEGLRLLSALLRDAPEYGPAHQALADYYERTGNHSLAAHHRQRASQPEASLGK